jgi:hypothetical protein
MQLSSNTKVGAFGICLKIPAVRTTELRSTNQKILVLPLKCFFLGRGFTPRLQKKRRVEAEIKFWMSET